eukprot:7633372-Pyramimonas_sp.AAC.1
MFKYLTIFAQAAQSSHITRRRWVGQLAAPRAGIPLAHRCRRALRGIFKSREIFAHPTQSSHIVRPGRVGQLGAGGEPTTLVTAGRL